jgi:hypothetical protein
MILHDSSPTRLATCNGPGKGAGLETARDFARKTEKSTATNPSPPRFDPADAAAPGT